MVQSVKMKRIYDRYNLKEYPCNNIGHLATFLTGYVYSDTYNYWFNFVDNKEPHATYETESINVSIFNNNIIIKILYHQDLTKCDNENPFIITKDECKRILLDWYNLAEKKVNGIIITEKNDLITLDEYPEKAIDHPRKKVKLGRREKYRNITLSISQLGWGESSREFLANFNVNVDCLSKEQKFVAYLPDRYISHPLSSLINFLNGEIEASGKKWTAWLHNTHETYKKSESSELKKIDNNKVLVSDANRQYEASIDDDPYAFYVSIDQLIDYITKWKKIRKQLPHTIVFIYRDHRVSIEAKDDDNNLAKNKSDKSTMRPIKFRKIYNYYVPLEYNSKHKGKYANLVLFLTEEVTMETFEGWIDFINNKEYGASDTNSIRLRVDDSSIKIYRNLDGNISEKGKTPFMIEQTNLKQLIFDWIELQRKEVNGIIMSKKNAEIILTESKKRFIPPQEKIFLTKKKHHKDNTIILAKIPLESESNTCQYTTIEKKYSFHPLNSFIALLENDIQANDTDWIKWLKKPTNIYKKSEFAELKKIDNNQTIIADARRPYNISIEKDPYALHISTDELIDLVQYWTELRMKKSERIMATYENNIIKFIPLNKNQGNLTQTMPLIYFPQDFYQLEVTENKNSKEYFKLIQFPQHLITKEEVNLMREAYQYCAKHELNMYITNGSKHYRLEGYTKSGIRIRINFDVNTELAVQAFPVVETTYENAMKTSEE